MPGDTIGWEILSEGSKPLYIMYNLIYNMHAHIINKTNIFYEVFIPIDQWSVF